MVSGQPWVRISRFAIRDTVAAMRFTFFILLNSSFFVAMTPAIAADPTPPITQDELVWRTQELCDAISPGNQAPWKKYYADDCIFSDEKGRILDKAKLVADITPMPAGYSGSIKVANVQSRIIGDTARPQLRPERNGNHFRSKRNCPLSYHRHLAATQR